MATLISINTDETERLLPDRNEIHTLYTAKLVHASAFDRYKNMLFTSQHANVSVTVVPTFVKINNSYKQVPDAKFCGAQQIHLTKGRSEINLSQDELSGIVTEECLNFSLDLGDDVPVLRCVCIHELGDTPGEYLYVFPPTISLQKLREIVDRPCKNVLERMLLLATSTIIHNEFESLKYLYNYCENMPLLNSTPAKIGDIALLTALELVGVAEAKLPPQNDMLPPVDNLANRLIATLVAHIQSKCRSKGSHEETLRKFLRNSTTIVSFYMELDSVLFAPFKLKADAKVLLYSTTQLIMSFFLFLFIFPIYCVRKLVRCDKHFFRTDTEGNFHQPKASRLFVFSSYFFLLLSIANTIDYYLARTSDVDRGLIRIWIPFILNFYTLVFAHTNIGAVHSRFSMPHFTSIKLSHDKAQMLVICPTQNNCTNVHLTTSNLSESDAVNRDTSSVKFDISWIKADYMKISNATKVCWYIIMGLLILMATVGQIMISVTCRSENAYCSTPTLGNITGSEGFTDIVNIISSFSAVTVLISCVLFYFTVYFTIKGILAKVHENDYAEINESNEFDVKKPESLEYLLTLIRVMIGSINHSLPHLIIIGSTVLVIVSLAITTLIFYIRSHSPRSIAVLSCMAYIVILAVPSIIILIKIALINTMVTRNLLEILQDHKHRLINQITKEQPLAMYQRNILQSSATDKVSKLMRAHDYLHEQIEHLTSQREINTVKLLGFLPISMPLLLSVGLAVVGSMIPYVTSLVGVEK